MMVEQIARVCHEANRAYCVATGDHSYRAWNQAPRWQKDSVINGVRFAIANPAATPLMSHVSWLQEKEANGWVYGEEKDPVAKTHPCMVPYHMLPPEQRMKDAIFLALVRTLASDH